MGPPRRASRPAALAGVPTTGRLPVGRAKVNTEANLDGKQLLATSDLDITAEDTAFGGRARVP
jgi:hypothetical protein